MRDATRRTLVATAFLAVAGACSLFRIAPAPGVELYLAPFFYLLLYRVAGVRAGMLGAAVLMSPSWWWWGHALSIGTAVGHVAWIHWLGRRRTLAEMTAYYQVTIAAAVGLGFLMLYYDAPLAVSGVVLMRKLLNDTLCAVCVDMLLLWITIDKRTLSISRRSSVRISSAILVTSMMFGMLSTATLFVGESLHFNQTFRIMRESIHRDALLWVSSRDRTGERIYGLQRFNDANGAIPVLIAPDRRGLGSQADLTRLLGCTTFDDGRSVHGANDRDTFSYWVNACQIRTVSIEGRHAIYASSIRPLAIDAYRQLFLRILGFSVIVLIGIFINLALKRRLDRSVDLWSGVLARFGHPDLIAPAAVPYREFERPIALFVETNNSFVSLVKERERTSAAISKLKDTIDLVLVTDIVFDPDTGQLGFTSLSRDRGRQIDRVDVHEADQQALIDAGTLDEGSIEFRIMGRSSPDWYMLIFKDRHGAAAWGAGCFLRLRQPKHAEDRMAHHVRLTELGGMVSALSHELKQPLFTIALAAENGKFRLMNDPAPDLDALLGKFRRIEDQVDRARLIMARISGYARIEAPEDSFANVADAVMAATTFMRPILIAHEVRLSVRSSLTEPVLVLVPQVGLEQIMVNSLQNSIDAIESRKDAEPAAPANIDITIALDEAALSIVIADTGMGLAGDAATSAFDPFFTTKPLGKGTGLGLYISRQIMMEVGGSVTIANGREGGAVVTITVPVSSLVASAPAQAPAIPTEAAA